MLPAAADPRVAKAGSRTADWRGKRCRISSQGGFRGLSAGPELNVKASPQTMPGLARYRTNSLEHAARDEDAVNMNPVLPRWLAVPLKLVAIHAILVLGSVLCLVTPFALVGHFLYSAVLVLDQPALSFYWDGEVSTLLLSGSVQWACVGAAVVAIETLIRRLVGA